MANEPSPEDMSKVVRQLFTPQELQKMSRPQRLAVGMRAERLLKQGEQMTSETVLKHRQNLLLTHLNPAFAGRP
jgi:hypothetical protein